MAARKSVYNEEKANSVFAVKIRKLFEESGKTHNNLAEYIEECTGESVTRQAVGQWCNGNTCPNLRTVPLIADYFGVSTDYLLTDTEIRTADTDMKAVCEYTGLSEGAVKRIQAELKDGPTPYTAFDELNTFSPMLQSDEFWNLVALIEKYNEEAPAVCYLNFAADALSEIVASDFNFNDKCVLLELIDELFVLDNKTIRANANYLTVMGSEQAETLKGLDDGIFLGSLPVELAAEAADRLAIIEYRATQKLVSLIKAVAGNSDIKAIEANNERVSEVLGKCSDISPGFADFVRNKLHEALLKAGE